MNKELNKSERLGLFLYYASGVLLIWGLFYMVYLSGDLEILKDMFDGIGLIGKFYFIMTYIGMGLFTIKLFDIATVLFYPEVKGEKKLEEKIRKLRKLGRKERSSNRREIENEIELLRTKQKLKELESYEQ